MTHVCTVCPTRVKGYGDPHYADQSQFLHPVVLAVAPVSPAYIKQGRFDRTVFELHLLEDVHTRFDNPKLHVEPLVRFLTKLQATGKAGQPERPQGAKTVEYHGPLGGPLPDTTAGGAAAAVSQK